MSKDYLEDARNYGDALWKIGISIAFEDGKKRGRNPRWSDRPPLYISPELTNAWIAGFKEARRELH